MRIAAAFLLLLIILPVYAASFQVGVSPAIVDAGNVAPGEQKIVKFSIFTVSDEPLLVFFDVESGNMDFFNDDRKYLRPSFSEEPTASWLEPIKNPVEIDTTTKNLGRSWTEVNMLLDVPETAEPGYHIIQVRPRPSVFGKVGGSVGTNLVAVTSVSVVFNVEGEAKREGIILDTKLAGITKSGFKLETPFKNTGTVTLYSYATNKVYDKDGTVLGEFHSSREYVKPGDIQKFNTPVTGLFTAGEYDIDSIVSFTTDDAEQRTTILLQEPPISQQAEEYPSLLIIFAVIIIILIAIFIYRRV